MVALVNSPVQVSSAQTLGALNASYGSQSGVPQTMPPLVNGGTAGNLSMPQFQQQIANWSASNPGLLGLTPQAHTPPLIYSPNTVPALGTQANNLTSAGQQFFQQHGYYPGG